MIAEVAKAPVRRTKAPKLWTYDELLKSFPESNLPMELWNGEIIMPPAPEFDHQQSTFDFAVLLRKWVEGHALGVVVISPFDMVLAPHQATQPDVLFVSKARLHLIQKVLRGPADLVAEVISPGSHNRDRINKRDLYELHGIKEYWILDPEVGTVEVLFLVKGEYKLVGRWREGERAKSRLLRGFEVAVDDVL